MEVFRCTVPVTLVLKRGVEILSEAQPDENSVRTSVQTFTFVFNPFNRKGCLKA